MSEAGATILPFPQADRDEIARFVGALFGGADPETHVNLRAFLDGEDKPFATDRWRAIRVSNGKDAIVDAALAFAQHCATARAVFCPPVATFNGHGAAENDLANGLALMVECDSRPRAALARLEELLGTASVVVASGGIWTNPETGEAEDKLHLYWRLAQPTRRGDEHACLKSARRLACTLVGSDASAVPVVHPLRWPGSVHRKAEPRLARIVGGDPEREMVLDDALSALRDAVGSFEVGGEERIGEPTAPLPLIEEALKLIPNDDRDWKSWSDIGMAIFRATGGGDAGKELFEHWSARSKKYEEATTKARWEHWKRSPPTKIGAGTLFYLARQEDPDWRPGPPIIDPAAPYDVAKRMLRTEFALERRQILYRHRGGFFLWNGSRYPELNDAEVRTRGYAYLDRCVMPAKDGRTLPVKPHSKMVDGLMDALRSAAALPPTVASPTWLRPDARDAQEIVACDNGLLDLSTLGLSPHTPEFFNHNALDFAFDTDAPEPSAWLAFLRQLWPHDDPAIETLQEIFGYSLTADTSQQKAFLLVGPRRSGKGTIGRVLRRLVGPENVVAPTLAGLGTNFGIQPLIGKRVAIISDARLGGRADQAAITERLLSITGEDAITVDRKYREAWTGQLAVRFVILTNELPRLADASGALAGRFIMLVLKQSFYGREDPALTNKLLAELPGILNWAIKGWKRLRGRGYFEQPPSARAAVRELEDLGSPIGAFVRDRCIVGAGYEVTVDDLFAAWDGWCYKQGREHSGDRQSFGRNLRAAVPGLSAAKQRRFAGVLERYYEGLRLKTSEEMALPEEEEPSG
jgi:putative DNA primase/helicase